MSRRSVWNAPQVRIEDTYGEPDPRSGQAPQTNNKPKRMPVRVGPGYFNGMACKPTQKPDPNQRRTIGPAYYTCILTPRQATVRRMPQKVVQTPKGVKLVCSEAKPVAAGGSGWPKSGPPKGATAQDVNVLHKIPATRKRALKQLDFNKQVVATGLGQSNIKSIDYDKRDAAAKKTPRVNNKSGETDLRRLALAQSSDRKQKKLDEVTVKSDESKLIFSPEPMNITPWSGFGRITASIPLSPMLLLSSRKDPAKQAQAKIRRTMLPVASTSTASNSQAGTQSARKRKEPPELCDLSDVEEATEISKMLDISTYVAYQSQFVNNSDVKNSGKDSLPTGKKMRLADRLEVQEQNNACQLPHILEKPVSSVLGHNARRDVLPCTVTPVAAASNVKVQTAAKSDKILALLIKLHAHDKQEVDIIKQQTEILQQQADIFKKQADLSKKITELKVKRLLIMDQFFNNNACASVNTCRSVPETRAQATSKPVSEFKSEPVSEPEPTTPSKRRSSRLARLSGIKELGTEDSDYLPGHNTLAKETGVTALVPQPTVQSPGVRKGEAGHSSAAPVVTETSYLDMTMPSPKVFSMPRRSIVDYEKLRASFPGLMKTPRKTPLKSCKKLAQVLDTPDISRRVQASLELLLDE